jgi:hypothetical protein
MGTGSAVVLVDSVVPVAAVPYLRAATVVYRGSGVDLPWAEPVPEISTLLARRPVVLLAQSLDDPAAAALRA